MIHTTERAAFNSDEIAALMLLCHEKEQDSLFAPSDHEEPDPADGQAIFWAHIGSQLQALRHYSVCCACLALVHKDDRDIHPCGPCECAATRAPRTGGDDGE